MKKILLILILVFTPLIVVFEILKPMGFEYLSLWGFLIAVLLIIFFKFVDFVFDKFKKE